LALAIIREGIPLTKCDRRLLSLDRFAPDDPAPRDVRLTRSTQSLYESGVSTFGGRKIELAIPQLASTDPKEFNRNERAIDRSMLDRE